MKFKRVEMKSRNELIRRLHYVTLAGSKEKVYEHAHIDLPFVHNITDEIHPCQYYVGQKDLDKVRDLYQSILTYSEGEIDIFNLNGYVEFVLEDSEDVITITPPICEVSLESNFQRVTLINDGMHRMFLARLLWQNVRIVLITNPSQPYYAYPIPGKDPWSKVQICNPIYVSAPIAPGLLKRCYRGTREEAKKLFRQFDAPEAFNTKHTRR